jgi:hypothetical protein
MNSLIINLFGGPGCGKSSMCASIFSYLKWNNIDCEMALEYAKDCVWTNTESLLKNQTYIFGQQHNRIFHLIGKVPIIITDSPLLLSILYDNDNNLALQALALSEFLKLNNKNYFLVRRKTYNPNGRLQTESEAKQLDTKLKMLLDRYNIAFSEVEGVPENAEIIGKEIISLLKKDNKI